MTSPYDDPWHFTEQQEAEASAGMDMVVAAIHMRNIVAYKGKLNGEEVILLGYRQGERSVFPLAVISRDLLNRIEAEGGVPRE